MTFRLLVLFLILFCGTKAITQCPPNGVTFLTQQELDNFIILYPNCTKINEDVSIGQLGSDISDLSPLSNLEIIGGRLLIQSVPLVTDLSAFDNLTEIGRDLWLSGTSASSFSFPNLATVGKSVSIGGHDNLLVFQGLNNLTYIGENLQFQGNNNLVEISGLQNVELIEGENLIFNNLLLETISALNTLDTIRTNVRIIQNPSLQTISGYSTLKYIGINFEYSSSGLARLSGFDALDEIGNRLFISGNNLLETIDGFTNLKTIGEDLQVRYNAAMDTMDGFPALEEIGEILLVEYNESLKEIKGFPALTNVKKGFSIRDNEVITDVNGFNSLQSFDGWLWFQNNPLLENFDGFRNTTAIGDGLVLRRNHSLQHLNALANVQSLGDNLTITDNDNLIQLDSLENIKSINGYISITANDMLTSINGIKNIDPYSVTGSFGTDLIITDNTRLEDCQVRSICAILSLPGKVHEIENNKTGCNSPEEIDCYVTGIGGYVFYDTNKNGIPDVNEFGINSQTVSISPDDYNTLTGQNGLYYLFTDNDENYEIAWEQDPLWSLSSDSSMYHVSVTGGMFPDEEFNFGLKPNFSGESATMSITSQQTRCNEQVLFKISYRNTGTFLLSGELIFNFDENTTLVYSDVIPDQVDTTNQLLKWNIVDLYPFEHREIEILMDMPSELFTGTYLDFNGQLLLGQDGNVFELSSTDYSSEVRCSYDPNDKLVNPIGVGIENLTPPETTLNYTVRFQNTGNAAAINIFILDTIDQNLDMESFKVTSSSFPVQTIVRDDIVRFNFNNIFLPDSLSDPIGSQGFVGFSIDPIPNLPDPTEVTNSASIYFDQNPPIITNTAYTIYGTPTVSVNEIYLDRLIEIFPNPMNEGIVVQFKQDIDYNNLKITVKDVSGKSVLTKVDPRAEIKNESISLKVQALNPGIYFISIQTEEFMITKKMIKN